MAKRDPLIYCPLIEWYLCSRDADCGFRSHFAAQVAAIEGHRGGYGGSDRFESEQVEFSTTQSAFAKDRVMRRRWGQLSRRDRDVLAAHYTGSAKVLTSVGWTRFPRGFEAHLGRFSGVALFLADDVGRLPMLARACELSDSIVIGTFKEAAEQACRAAHGAYYAIAQEDESELTDQHPLSGMFAVEATAQDDWPRNIDGIWRQRP